MYEVQDKDIGFKWDIWEREFRGVVDKIRDEEWGNLDDNFRQMEEQEDGIFAEIKKHSDDIGSKMTNNKGKIVEVMVVENKTVNRPNGKDDSVVMVENVRETDQLNENKGDQGTDKNVSDANISNRYNKDDIMDILRTISSNIKELGNDIKGLNNDMKERNKKWEGDRRQLKENTEVELKQVSVCNDNMMKNSEEIINKVSDSYKRCV